MIDVGDFPSSSCARLSSHGENRAFDHLIIFRPIACGAENCASCCATNLMRILQDRTITKLCVAMCIYEYIYMYIHVCISISTDVHIYYLYIYYNCSRS